MLKSAKMTVNVFLFCEVQLKLLRSEKVCQKYKINKLQNKSETEIVAIVLSLREKQKRFKCGSVSGDFAD